MCDCKTIYICRMENEQDTFDNSITVRCSTPFKKEIEALAKEDGRKTGAFVRRVLEVYKKQQKKKK